jgi:hypothetical protein
MQSPHRNDCACAAVVFVNSDAQICRSGLRSGRIGHYPLVSEEPMIPHLSVSQRFDLLAVSKPNSVRRSVWVFGVLGIWQAIGGLASLATGSGATASIFLATAAVSTLGVWVSRRSLRRVPATTRWIEEAARQRRG